MKLESTRFASYPLDRTLNSVLPLISLREEVRRGKRRLDCVPCVTTMS